MRSILKLMWANISGGKGSFKGMILLMMLITFSFSGTVSNDDRLKEALDEKFSEAAVSDLIVNISDDNLTDDILESVREHPDVEDVEVRPALFFAGAMKLDGADNNMTISVRADDGNTRVFTDDGNAFVKDFTLSDGEILLPYKMRLAEGFKVGSEIALRTRTGFDEKYTIKGFYEDILTGASTMGWDYCVVTQHDFDRVRSEKADHIGDESSCVLVIDWLHIDARDGVNCVELRKALADDTTLISSANNAMTRDYLYDNIELYSRVGTRTVGIFVVLLLAVTLITMYNSLSATIELDSTELGILKAEGFTTGQISLVYILQYLIALVIGGVAGILVSIPACHFLIGAWKNITGIMSETTVSFAKCGGMCVAMILVCALFVCIATARIRKISPVRALSGSREDVYFDSRLKTRIRKKPLNFFLAVRQLDSQRSSYIGTVLIVMMLVFFIVSILILSNGLDMDKMYYNMTGEVAMTDIGGLKISDMENIEKDAQSIDDAALTEYSVRHYMLIDGESVRVYAYHTSEAVNKPEEGRAAKYDNEIMLTRYAAEQLGKQIGDNVKVKYMDTEREYVITGYYQTMFDFGYAAEVTMDGMLSMGYDEICESYVKLGDKAAVGEMTDMLNDNYSGLLEASEFESDAFTESYKKVVDTLMYSLTIAMYVVLMIFAAVVVNMVCKRAFIRERTDIGIYKAVGFTADGLRRQFAVRFTVVAAVGAALGCIAGMCLSRKMIIFILRVVGLTDFTTDYAPMTFIGPALAVGVCFYVAAYISAGKVKKVEVRELITE